MLSACAAYARREFRWRALLTRSTRPRTHQRPGTNHCCTKLHELPQATARNHCDRSGRAGRGGAGGASSLVSFPATPVRPCARAHRSGEPSVSWPIVRAKGGGGAPVDLICCTHKDTSVVRARIQWIDYLQQKKKGVAVCIATRVSRRTGVGGQGRGWNKRGERCAPAIHNSF